MIAQCRQRWAGAGFSFVKDEGTARLMDILLFGPLLIATGAIVPNLPKEVKVTLIGAGVFVILWNGIGYLANINEAMRTKMREQGKPHIVPELPNPDWDSEAATPEPTRHGIA